MIALLALITGAFGADWPTLQGTEPEDGGALRPQGFVQVAAEGYLAEPVEGLVSEGLAPYEGELAVFNTFGGSSPYALTLRRVRVGGRGEVPGTNGVFSGNVAVELGQNPLTLSGGTWQPHLMDASITVRGPVSVRAGQFKLPMADESLEAVHITSDLIRFSGVTGTLLMERDASSGAFTGVVNGFRDVGLQVFGSHLAGDVELSWAAMGSAGALNAGDMTPHPTGTARLQLSHLPEGSRRRHPSRDEESVWVFAHAGERAVGDDTALRLRWGAGAQVAREAYRLRSEVISASGVLNVGMAPPFAGGAVQVDPDGRAWGVTGLATTRIQERWELGVAYSHLDVLPDGGPDRRLFDDLTGIAQLHMAQKAWLDLNLTWREAGAPEGSEDAQTILATRGPYAGLMLTIRS